MSYLTRLCFLALGCLLIGYATSAPALAQPTPPEAETRTGDRLWFGGGMGSATRGMGLASHWTYETGPHLLSLRSAMSADLLASLFGSEDGTVYDFGLLYGRRLAGDEYAFVSAGLGVAGVAGLDESVTLGLPVEIQAAVRLTSWFGLEAYGFGNLNRRRSFAGVAVGFQVGQLYGTDRADGLHL